MDDLTDECCELISLSFGNDQVARTGKSFRSFSGGQDEMKDTNSPWEHQPRLTPVSPQGPAPLHMVSDAEPQEATGTGWDAAEVQSICMGSRNQLVMRTGATRAGRSPWEGNVPTASGRASASLVAAGWARALHSPPAPRDSPLQPEHRNLGD